MKAGLTWCCLAVVCAHGLVVRAQVTAPRDGLDEPLPAGVLTRLGSTRYRHATGENRKWFLPDSATIVSTSNRALKFWNARTGTLIRKQAIRGDQHLSLGALSRDGKLFAAPAIIAADGKIVRVEIHLIDTRTGEPVRIIQRSDRGGENHVALTPDGKHLISIGGSPESVLRVENIATGAEERKVTLPRGSESGVTVSPDGEWLGILAGHSMQMVWKWREEPEPRNLPAIGRPEETGHLTFSEDSRWVVGIAGVGHLHIWDTRDGSIVRRLHVPGESLDYGTIAFAPDGKRLYAQTWNGKQYQARVWNTATWEMEQALPISGSFILSPDGKLLGCYDRVYDLERDVLLQNAESHTQQLARIVTIDQDRLATASHDGTVRVWEIATGKQLLSLSNEKHGACGLAASPDGTRLLSSGVDDTIRLWELPSGKKIFQLPGHGELSPGSVAFSADGQRFYSFGRDFYLREYDTQAGKALEEFAIRTPGLVLPSDDQAGQLNIAGVNFSRPNFAPGGEWLALGSGKQYHVVESKTGKTIKSFDSSPGINRDLLFSPAGDLLLACAFDFSAAKKHHSTLWNVRDGSVVVRLESANDAFGPACFTSDGQRFAVAVYNKEQGYQVRIYNRQGKRLSTMSDIPQQVSALAFTHDGSGIITGLTDASILVWGPAAFIPAKTEETQP